MLDSYHDLETFSPIPLKDGTHRYSEGCEIMVWSFALEDGTIFVWDLVNRELHWLDDFSGAWDRMRLHADVLIPAELYEILRNEEALVWFQNGGMFDFVMLDNTAPEIAALIPMERRRDTMVQAYAHGLPGSLEKLGVVLKLDEDKRKIAEGKRLIQLFCKPQNEDFVKKFKTNRATRETHPHEWQRFIEYAAGDIITMRAVHKKIPMWNYRDHQVDLCMLDWKINNRGFQIDMDLVHAAISASDREKARLAREVKAATNYDEALGTGVASATQRDVMLKHILQIWGIELPDLQADTLERRIEDPDLPEEVKELLRIRLSASMNSVSKYKRLQRGVSKDGRLRGGAQFRGAGRTGRTAHRLFQHGNLPRPNLALKKLIEPGIAALKLGCADMVVPDVLDFCRTAVRGSIVAKPGHKLIIVDLSNIEGRDAAWLAGEEWKLEAYRDYDTIVGHSKDGKPIRKGHDLYVKAYMNSFNVTDPALVGFDERQIGKVEELMFQYGGGVGAWITGAATYGIHLDRMTEAVYPTLPDWATGEAKDYLESLYEAPLARHFKRVKRGRDEKESFEIYENEKVKARFGLEEKVFIACDAIKRMWREVHPATSSYWKGNEQNPGLELCFRAAIAEPGVTFECRRVKIKRDGVWIRIRLPSGRVLCYLNPKVEDDNSITCAGFNQYTRKWERIKTYGGKLFENITQAVACDQLFDGMELIENNGYPVVFHVHDEVVCEVPDTSHYKVDDVIEMITADFGWNSGTPLAAEGYETHRYYKK